MQTTLLFKNARFSFFFTLCNVIANLKLFLHVLIWNRLLSVSKAFEHMEIKARTVKGF